MDLPDFKYHPNPIATGSIVPSVEVCPVCGESRGLAYDGIPYGTNDLEHICPWCIADGSAHEKFGGTHYGDFSFVSRKCKAEIPPRWTKRASGEASV